MRLIVLFLTITIFCTGCYKTAVKSTAKVKLVNYVHLAREKATLDSRNRLKIAIPSSLELAASKRLNSLALYKNSFGTLGELATIELRR